MLWGVVAFGADGRWFESHYSRHIGSLGKSFTRSCLKLWRDVAPCVDVLRLNSTPVIAMLLTVHTLLVNILQCVTLYIKTK